MLRTPFKATIISTIILSGLLCVNAQADTDSSTSSVTTSHGPNDSSTTTTTIQPSADGSSATQTVDTHTTVVTTVPTPNSTTPSPEGFVSCNTIASGWHDNYWVPTHKVCKYENASQGVAWIEGYWRCDKATSTGSCVMWEWRDERWVKEFSSY